MPSDIAKQPPPLIIISGGLVSHVHTLLGLLAFLAALVTALCLHYEKVVKNHVAQYPQEWWPSVSATIGDWYPERNIFQVGIALMAGPRFALVFLSALLVSLSAPSSSVKTPFLLAVGVVRTLACGGWVYVTSTDDHRVHDIAMFLYLALTPPWMFITSGSLTHADNSEPLARRAKQMRRIAAASFFACTPFMVFFFYRHNALRIPGAYSYYAYFEWGLIIFDLLFDAASVYDLSRLEIHIVQASRPGVDVSAPQRLVDGAWIQGGKAQSIASGAWPASLSHNEGVKHTAPHAVDSTSPPKPGSPQAILSLLSDSYLAFCFWTSLTALHPMIFYFSVYNLAIGGHELLLISQVIGLSVALFVPPLRKMTIANVKESVEIGRVSHRAKALGWLLSLVGQGSWWVPNPLIRLCAVAFSNALLAVLLTVEWGSAWELHQLQNKIGIWLIGLLLSNLAKYANHSNNPAWPFLNSSNGGLNGILLAIGLLAVIEMATRCQFQDPPIVRKRAPQNKSSESGGFWSSALGLGAVLFTLHTHLTDTGTLIAWGWTGFPIKGPMAIPHGYVLLLAMTIASLIATRSPSFGYRLTLLIIHGGSAALIYFATDWVSFLGAIGFAVTLPPLAFPIISAAMPHHPIKVMLAAWLIADFLTFLGVLTVAYAFVPGGQIMRERTGFMLIMQWLLLAFGLFNARRVDQAPSIAKMPKNVKGNRLDRPGSTKYICILMTIIGLLSTLVPFYRVVPPASIVPHHPEDRLVTAGMWTVHFALDQHMHDSSRRMASIMKTLEMDLFGLVESDLHRPVFGNRDLTQYLAEELGMYADIGPSPSKNTWGAALFSKFPIINSTHHLLPSPHGELAPAIHAVIDMYGTPVHVIVSHNGQEEDALDRELQTTEIARILRDAYPHPAIFLGYVVTKPTDERPAPYKILFEDGRIHDVESTDIGRWCQYLGFRGVERVSYVRVSRYTVTDTELQTMKVVIPRHPIDPDNNELSMYVGRDHYPKSMHYPSSLIDPPAFVYDKHKYSPYPYPIYYARPN